MTKYKKVKYTVKDARAIEIAKGSFELNAFGSFDFVVTLPENINTGDVSVNFELALEDKEKEKCIYEATSREFTHTFSIQEVSELPVTRY